MKFRKTLCCAVVVAVLGAYSADSALATHKVKVQTYTIVGTFIEFDEFGLPARLEGDIFYRGGKKDGRFAGTYLEKLTPIFFEGNFVGTSGVSVFTFKKVTLITVNISHIVGIADGAFIVESTGQVVENDGRGRNKKIAGELMSSSTVILGPNFAMNVELTLSLSKVH